MTQDEIDLLKGELVSNAQAGKANALTHWNETMRRYNDKEISLSPEQLADLRDHAHEVLKGVEDPPEE